jgi:hypothetical protein
LCCLLAVTGATALGIGLVFVVNSRYESSQQWESYQRSLMDPVTYSLARALNQAAEPIWSKVPP